MKSAASIVRDARRAAGLTQAELARRMGTTQSAVARLEREGANPRLATLREAVRATGRHLDVVVDDYPPGSIDAALTESHVRVAPAERLRSFVASRNNIRDLARAADRSRERAG